MATTASTSMLLNPGWRLLGWLSVLLLFCITANVFAAQQVTLAWDANTESTLVGYKVYYGTASRAYNNTSNPVVVTAPTTTASLTLEDGTYYFAVKAYDGSGAESGFSNEVSTTISTSPSLVADFSANPTSGMAPLKVTFTDNSSGPVAKRLWKFGDGSTSTAVNPSHDYAAGTFPASLTVSDSLGKSSSPKTISVNASSSSSGPLPSPWQDQDIGSVGLKGSAEYDYASKSFKLIGSGADIWGRADAFHFAYQTLNGNGTIVARVAGMTKTNSWAKAGVMIRETLNPDSKHAMVAVTAGNGVAFQRRRSNRRYQRSHGRCGC